MDYIDKIYYINLDKRDDRNSHMKQVLRDLNVPDEKIHRISAVYTPDHGEFGCSESHINTLKDFIKSEKSTCLILEDDFMYDNKDTFWNSIEQVFKQNIDFDAIQLAYNHEELRVVPADHPLLKKVIASTTASAYIVTKSFAPKLLDNYERGLNELKWCYGKYKFMDGTYVLDMHWKVLQPISKWFCFSPRLGFQNPSYSDIRKEFADYSYWKA